MASFDRLGWVCMHKGARCLEVDPPAEQPRQPPVGLLCGLLRGGVGAETPHGSSASAEGQEEEFSKLLFQAAHKLIDEINAQQQLLAAERGELLVKTVPLISLEILHNALALYEKHLVAQQRYLRIDPESELFLLHTDEALLGRVIGNMVKNALEACRPEETVTLGCRIQEGMACFWVHNPAVMSPTVQLQIFNRSFSTKGHDRGLGTYSIKLLSERYLGGAISFTSSEGEGTVFTAIYPLNW